MSDIHKKAAKLFEFIQDFSTIKGKDCLDIHNQIVAIYKNALDLDSQYIRWYGWKGIHIVHVQKPVFETAPQPPDSIIEWLACEWTDYNIDLRHRDECHKVDEDTGENEVEKFEEDAGRVEDFERYAEEWEAWSESQKPLGEVVKVFELLYKARKGIQREPERLEMLVADGIVVGTLEPKVKHPLLVRNVSIEFDSEKNCIYIDNTESDTRIYPGLYRYFEEHYNGNGQLDSDEISALEKELMDCHPLDKVNVKSLVTRYLNELSAKKQFLDEEPARGQELSGRNELFAYSKPVFFLQVKSDGSYKAASRIADAFTRNQLRCPGHLVDIIAPQGGLTPMKPAKRDVWASIGGESVEILLAKPANEEQLDIAEKIASQNAVLVQGPPGTGKSHTIANLLGHFLAQGNNVLVTSHTTKALSVLKNLLPENLQGLCVSMLDDNNSDFVSSVRSIADKLTSSKPEDLASSCAALAEERQDAFGELSQIRQNIFRVEHSEQETIPLRGEMLPLHKVAKKVCDGREAYGGTIPGRIDTNRESFPLTNQEWSELYRTNKSLSQWEEDRLGSPTVDLDKLPTPDALATMLAGYECDIQELKKGVSGWVPKLLSDGSFQLKNRARTFVFQVADKDGFDDLKEGLVARIESAEELCRNGDGYTRAIEAGMRNARAERNGMVKPPYAARWQALLRASDEANAFLAEEADRIRRVTILGDSQTVLADDVRISLQKAERYLPLVQFC